MAENLAIENASSESSRVAEQVAVKILPSSVVELEAVHAISLKDVRTGDAIPFRVACPVIVDGVTIIAAGTMAMGVITEAETCGRCGQLDHQPAFARSGPRPGLGARCAAGRHSLHAGYLCFGLAVSGQRA